MAQLFLKVCAHTVLDAVFMKERLGWLDLPASSSRGFRVRLLQKQGYSCLGPQALCHGHCGSYPNLLRGFLLASGSASWQFQLRKSYTAAKGVGGLKQAPVSSLLQLGLCVRVLAPESGESQDSDAPRAYSLIL